MALLVSFNVGVTIGGAQERPSHVTLLLISVSQSLCSDLHTIIDFQHSGFWSESFLELPKIYVQP